MRNRIKMTIASALALMAIVSTGCDKHDEEEELITTLKLTVVNKATGAVTTATFADPDGDGGNAPTKFDTLRLSSGANYETTVSLYDESTANVVDLTTEIATEANDHQFYYSTTASGVSIATTDTDANGLPLGLKANVSTSSASTGRLQIKLKHKPDGLKKAGDSDAVGETDIELPLGGFYVVVQ
ncbi:MAG: hypothetical protein RL660_2321 [Bacteroidota bacterium]|jgi:hypothetical protein